MARIKIPFRRPNRTPAATNPPAPWHYVGLFVAWCIISYTIAAIWSNGHPFTESMALVTFMAAGYIYLGYVCEGREYWRARALNAETQRSSTQQAPLTDVI
jgi:hypothetical protein